MFEEWRSHVDEYGDTSVVPTRQFAAPMKVSPLLFVDDAVSRG